MVFMLYNTTKRTHTRKPWRTDIIISPIWKKDVVNMFRNVFESI